MMAVKDLATAAGSPPDTVRYDTRIGLLCPVRDSKNGYRRFSAENIHRMKFICRAKVLGFTLSEIAYIDADAEAGKSPCPRVREMIRRRIEENRQYIDELKVLQARMKSAAGQWQGMRDGIPADHAICRLIEVFDA